MADDTYDWNELAAAKSKDADVAWGASCRSMRVCAATMAATSMWAPKGRFSQSCFLTTGATWRSKWYSRKTCAGGWGTGGRGQGSSGGRQGNHRLAGQAAGQGGSSAGLQGSRGAASWVLGDAALPEEHAGLGASSSSR